MIQRKLEKTIEKWLFKGKLIILYGPRQVGKTTLSKRFVEKYGDKNSYINCEIIDNRVALENQNPSRIREFLGNGNFFVLDEAQKVKEIGTILKLLVDTYPDIQIIATGSSSFDLSNKINEPLTGRALEFILYPISFAEYVETYSMRDAQQKLEKLLRFGSYPDIITKPDDEARVLLTTITGQYLYKDLFDFEDIRKPDMILNLLRLVAFQVGNEVSINELAIKLEVSTKTISRYLDLLEKAFVIFRLSALSRNPRNEIGKKQKIYFYDLGVRNSLIQSHNRIELRDDIGALWENFCMVERKKKLQYEMTSVNQFFWRNVHGSEIDYVEERDGAIYGYEFKWRADSFKIPKSFVTAYNAKVSLVNSENFTDFVM
ncbi:MAG: hypothetical protein A3D92_18490 [Bacteroidetes bacterium RIFCSPHIGHO2_02_FULL_44_7]|nr:MAG: hypothetical protein A3D92_18490 [Bacteroidetes bacterium RIFCSPHIGHO2_02_FULL_44_7]